MGGKHSKSSKSPKSKIKATKMAQNPVVNTKYGDLRGSITYTIGSKKPVYNFLSVPYASPLCGDKRFCAPEPPQPWKGVRDATKLGPACPQDMKTTRIAFQPVPVPETNLDEANCLQLNIYTCQLNPKAQAPVMFYIHGGSFNKGMGGFYDGTAYASFGDVVLVTINYRLGFLGYLDTEDEFSPGNYGFLDQIEALRWVQENIAMFGGDPGNVTIFGESAGSASVQVMLLSSLADGLFHKAISQSASVLLPNIIHKGTDRAWELVKVLGFEPTDSKSLVSYLRQVPIDDLMNAQTQLVARGLSPALSMDGQVITESPRHLYSSGNFKKLPHLLGFNSDEGYYFCNSLCPEFSTDDFSEEKAMNFLLRFFSGRYPGHEIKALNMVKELYFPDEEKEKRKDLEYLRIVCSWAIGELFISAPTWLAGELHSAHAPTFMYVYTHKPGYSRFGKLPPGGSHEEELLLAWGDPWMERPVNKVVTYTEPEKQLSLKMIQYWTNFAKTGDPNGDGLVKWPKFDVDKAEYLQLDCEISAAHHFKPDNMQLCNYTLYDATQ